MDSRVLLLKRAITIPRSMFAIAWSVLLLLPVLYVYFVLASVDFFHPIQFISDIFGGSLTVTFYGVICALVLFVCLAYKVTVYHVVHSRFITPWDNLKIVFSWTSLVQLLVHFLTSLLIGILLTDMIGGRYGTIYVPCSMSSAYEVQSNRFCLNEHKCFVLMFCALAGSVYSLEASAFDFNCLRFSSRKAPLFKVLQENLGDLLKYSTKASRRSIFFFYAIYAFFGGISTYLLSSIFNLDIDAPVGLGSWWNLIDLALLYQTYIAGVFIRFILSSSSLVINEALTKHVNFTLTDDRAEDSLITCLELQDNTLIKFLAYKDLTEIANCFDDERRSKVFSLSMPGGHARKWMAIYICTTAILKQMLERIVSYNLALASTYKNMNRQPHAQVETLKPGYLEKNKAYEKLDSSVIKRWYLPEFSDKVSALIFHDSQIHIWAASGLAGFVSRSYTEDKYGIVQQNLGDILSLFLELHEATEKLFRAVPVLGRNPEPSDMNSACHELALEFRQTLKSSVEILSKTFGQHVKDVAGLSLDQMKKLQALALS